MHVTSFTFLYYNVVMFFDDVVFLRRSPYDRYVTCRVTAKPMKIGIATLSTQANYSYDSQLKKISN